MMKIWGRLTVVVALSFAFACAASVKDSRDGRTYKMMPSGKLNWFTSNVSLDGKPDFKDRAKVSFYKKESWSGLCPAGTHLPDLKEWNDLAEDKFMGPRKKQNAKAFAGNTRGYYDMSKKNPKVQGKDAAYFAIAGDAGKSGIQALMLDLKRGSFQKVNLPKESVVAVRCVTERDLLAEKNISKDDMLMTDTRDERQYKVKIVGDKIWMVQNIRYGLTDAKTQCLLEDMNLCKKYGRFYTHDEAKKACPKGWHLPDDGEWRDFQKERSQWDWNSMGVGGCKDWDQYCDGTNTGHYWSATSIKRNTGRSWEFRREARSINRTDESVRKGLYVRCVADMR